jgi:hypothetical protein
MPSLAVPHRKQVDFGYCLPACVEMVFAYYGVTRSQVELGRQLGMIAGVGVPASRVARVASEDLLVERKSGSEIELLEALSSGVPPILEVMTGALPYWTEDTSHVILVAGVEMSDGGRIAVINDPAFDVPQQTNFDAVMLAWVEKDNYMTLWRRHPSHDPRL